MSPNIARLHPSVLSCDSRSIPPLPFQKTITNPSPYRRTLFYSVPARHDGALSASLGDDEVVAKSATIDANGDAKQRDEDDDDDEGFVSDTGREILSLAVPALAGLAIDPIMTLVDTVFVGRTASNADALAGMGSAAALLTFSFYVFNFLCTVTTPLVSRDRAAGNEDAAVELSGRALGLAIALGAILTLVLWASSEPLLTVMGTGRTGEDAAAYAASFLGVRAAAAPAVFLISASTGILRGYLDTRTTVVLLLVTNAVNLSLDLALIVRADMGPLGAAIATTTAEWLSAGCLLLILAGRLPSVDGVLGSNQKGVATVIRPILDVPSWETIRPLVVASSSVFVRSFVLQLSIAGAAAAAARGGGDLAAADVAAHQIALQLWLLGSFVCDALAAASQALVADRLGREDADGTRDVSRAVFLYSAYLGAVLVVGLLAGDRTGVLTDAFTSDAPTREALRGLLPVLIAAQPLNALVFSADGVLQGASEFAYQARAMVLSVVVALGGFWALERYDGGNGTLVHVWTALVLLQLMRGATSLWKLADADGPIDVFGLTTLHHEEEGGVGRS